MSDTALQRAADGHKVEGKAAVSGLKAAVEKIESLKDKAATLKENGATAAMMGLHTVETQVAVFGGSMAEGMWGRDKLKVGGVPIRGVLGLGLAGWGLMDAVQGKGGGHQLALGNGLMASETASMGVLAGQALREKMDKKDGAAPGAQQPAAPAPQQPAQIQGEDDLAKLARKIQMKPGTAGDKQRRDGWTRARN